MASLVEIYRTGEGLEADAVRDEVLQPNQVECVILDRTSHPFNTPTMAGGYYIAVPDEQAERARALILEAREAGVLSPAGEVL